ncbi:hypothetical protein GLYMA_08G183200v4 [Glycine max]|uniref:Uncharacterized protein n=1 Tax=Glycine max TaxID=3847 RepID=A0A0R0IVA3_SOYBN|nr:hypothetical protein JHK85_022189 [Glycine max]KAH1051846.1 hypothetical protein GYH30_021646 [Glycine max]KRH43963.1 hypothetical protein GLYMA_08G183200v4 [Glycine max]
MLSPKSKVYSLSLLFFIQTICGGFLLIWVFSFYSTWSLLKMLGAKLMGFQFFQVLGRKMMKVCF